MVADLDHFAADKKCFRILAVVGTDQEENDRSLYEFQTTLKQIRKKISSEFFFFFLQFCYY